MLLMLLILLLLMMLLMMLLMLLLMLLLMMLLLMLLLLLLLLMLLLLLLLLLFEKYHVVAVYVVVPMHHVAIGRPFHHPFGTEAFFDGRNDAANTGPLADAACSLLLGVVPGVLARQDYFGTAGLLPDFVVVVSGEVEVRRGVGGVVAVGSSEQLVDLATERGILIAGGQHSGGGLCGGDGLLDHNGVPAKGSFDLPQEICLRFHTQRSQLSPF